MSVHKKLMQARIQLQNTQLKKTGLNKFAGFKYFELCDFLPTIQTIMMPLGLCGIVSFTKDIATLTITDTDDCTSLQITSPMGSAALKGVHEVQNIGAVETYQRRYLWVSAFEIVEHDALDSSPPAEKKGFEFDVIYAIGTISLVNDITELKNMMRDCLLVTPPEFQKEIRDAGNKRHAILKEQEKTLHELTTD